MVQSTPLSSLMQACQAKVLPRWCRRQNGSMFLPDVLPLARVRDDQGRSCRRARCRWGSGRFRHGS
jgi:hypothetical protein